MSINKAQISRTLVINSPVHLWTLLKNKESKICCLDLAEKNQWCGRRFYLP